MSDSVVFLFIQKNKVLLSYKKTATGKYDDLSIPSGRITDKDRSRRHSNGKEHAMHREIYEVFDGTVIPFQYEYMDSIDDEDRNSTLAVFFIYSWDGDHPMYMKRAGERIGRLRWFTINEALEAVKHESELKILRWAKETIRIKAVLYGRLYS